MVASAAHIPGHAASHSARLKEEAYVVRHSGDLFYPFAVEVFGTLHSTLDRFLRSTAALCMEQWQYPPVSVVTAFLRQQCRLHFKGLRPSRSNGGRRRLGSERLGMFLSLIRL
ncbi:unnamed protein product [Calypogeia fissa]